MPSGWHRLANTGEVHGRLIILAAELGVRDVGNHCDILVEIKHSDNILIDDTHSP
jgi:hypothetical protein